MRAPYQQGYPPMLRVAILRTVGAAPDYVKPDGFTRFSTNGQPSNTHGWVIAASNGVFHFGCWRQGVQGCWPEPHTVLGTQYITPRTSRSNDVAVEEELQERARINARTWHRATFIEAQSPVGTYLKNRGLDLTDHPPSLRISVLPYYEDGVERGRFPVMLGAVTDKEGKLLALHRTFVTDVGHKASVENPKKLTRASGTIAGASIKLRPPEIIEGKLTLGVAEGIETALACWLGAQVPTWSCVSANGINTFNWPPDLERLVIFADHDLSGVGQVAANALAARAAAAGLEVRILIPTTAGADWLDVYQGEAE
jgi:putative DNA primase/helicase